MTKRLFIGGPADGKIIDVPDYYTAWYVPDEIPPATLLNLSAAIPPDASMHVYVRKCCVSRDREFIVFTYGEMRSYEVIEKLIEGYRNVELSV